MEDLRWILLLLGGLFVLGLTLWEMRRSRAARGELPPETAVESARRSERREPSLGDAEPEEPFDVPEIRAGDPSRDLPVVSYEEGASARDAVDIGIADEVAVDRPRAAGARAEADAPAPPPQLRIDISEDLDATGLYAIGQPLPGGVAGQDDAPDGPAPEPVARPPVQWPPERQDRILALRIVPPSGGRFGGRSLRLALTSNGLELGPQDIFHGTDDAGRVVVSAAGLTRPGTFSLDTMDGQFFLGLHLFSVLPGPLPPRGMLDELTSVAFDVAVRLGGHVLDDLGRPLDEPRLEELRASVSPRAPSTGAGPYD